MQGKCRNCLCPRARTRKSAAMIALLKETKLPQSEISARFRVSQGLISRLMAEEGIQRPEGTVNLGLPHPKTREIIRLLKTSTLSLPKIARQTGAAIQTVYEMQSRHGILRPEGYLPTEGRPVTSDKTRKIRSGKSLEVKRLLEETALSQKTIAVQTRSDPSLVSRIKSGGQIERHERSKFARLDRERKRQVNFFKVLNSMNASEKKRIVAIVHDLGSFVEPKEISKIYKVPADFVNSVAKSAGIIANPKKASGLPYKINNEFYHAIGFFEKKEANVDDLRAHLFNVPAYVSDIGSPPEFPEHLIGKYPEKIVQQMHEKKLKEYALMKSNAKKRAAKTAQKEITLSKKSWPLIEFILKKPNKAVSIKEFEAAFGSKPDIIEYLREIGAITKIGDYYAIHYNWLKK